MFLSFAAKVHAKILIITNKIFFIPDNYRYIKIMAKAIVQLYHIFAALPCFTTFAAVLEIAF